MDTLVVLSHLRWDFVYQRPQHLLTRLARTWRIVFVEEPVKGEGEARAESIAVEPNITVVRFHTPVESPGFHDDQLAELRPLLATTLRNLGVENYGVWFYTPMALPLLAVLSPEVVCYDCMDELSAFRNSPRQLLQRERALLAMADVVFTGGPSLYRSKRTFNDNVHCVPSAVDVEHFARARHPVNAAPNPATQAQPRLGFYGVVDERFDLALLEGCARLRPDWQFNIVGPVVKIDPATLPHLPNIHYQGMRAYADLPDVLAAWDIALMPFARNEATRFISPTKTLEYLAGGKPVVTTSIADVVELYGANVKVADDAEGFIKACEAYMAESNEARVLRAEASWAQANRSSWDAAAAAIVSELEDVLLVEARDVAVHSAEPSRDRPRTLALAHDAVAMRSVVGAGSAGLAAAHMRSANATGPVQSGRPVLSGRRGRDDWLSYYRQDGASAFPDEKHGAGDWKRAVEELVVDSISAGGAHASQSPETNPS